MIPNVSPLTTESEAQAMATKRRSADYREMKAQAKKICCIKQRSTPSNILQASQVCIATTKGPDYTCVCYNRLMYR